MKEYSKTYYLSAGECTPQAELPLPLLMNRIIDVATMHANSWGVGYERLIADNHAWVLARVTIEMDRYPRVNENYTLTTWIEDYNHLFSQRNMEVSDHNGETIGYVRTIWMVIDLSTRQSVDISKLSYFSEHINNRPCPIAPQSKLLPVKDGLARAHVFKYVDCDFNRHVNTVRYLELLLNQFSLEHFDNYYVNRLELAFLKETHYGEIMEVLRKDDGQRWLMAISANGADHVRASIRFLPRNIEKE